MRIFSYILSRVQIQMNMYTDRTARGFACLLSCAEHEEF